MSITGGKSGLTLKMTSRPKQTSVLTAPTVMALQYSHQSIHLSAAHIHVAKYQLTMPI